MTVQIITNRDKLPENHEVNNTSHPRCIVLAHFGQNEVSVSDVAPCTTSLCHRYILIAGLLIGYSLSSWPVRQQNDHAQCSPE